MKGAPSFQVNSEMQVSASVSSGTKDLVVKLLTQDRCSTGTDDFLFESLGLAGVLRQWPPPRGISTSSE